MRTYDVTIPIHQQMPVWPGDPKIQMQRISKIEEGASANVTQISMTVHAGTHIDAPYHFLGGEAATVEQLHLNLLTGRAYVLHLKDEVNLITADILQKSEIPPRTRRILFRTRNSHLWETSQTEFQTNFVALSPDGAQFLIDRGVKLVGIDYLSIAPYKDGVPTHTLLLEAGVVIVEGLDLSQVTQGRYSLYCLPLKLTGVDGAPARAILIGV
jgi:arylformamidase